LAQRESASFTPRRSLVRSQYRPPRNCRSKLADVRRELDQGVKSSPTYTVEQAVEDWLKLGMGDKAPKMITTLTGILEPLTDKLGRIALRDLTAEDVRKVLASNTETRASRTVRDTRAALVRVIKFAQARGLIARNVAARAGRAGACRPPRVGVCHDRPDPQRAARAVCEDSGGAGR
jgi:hypothetical protein